MGNEGVAAVEKALCLLDCFQPGREQFQLTELAEASGMHKTTVYRLMNSLQKMGYVMRSASGAYSLGHRLLYLGKLYEQSFHLAAVVEPALRALSARAKESASYYVHNQGHRLCLFRVEPATGLRDTRLAGTSFPFDDTCVSQVLRYWGLEEPVFDTPPQLPLFTIGIHDSHTASFAAPVFGSGNHFVAALSLSGPASRLNLAHEDNTLATPLLEAALELSVQIGASRSFCTSVYWPTGSTARARPRPADND